MRQTVAIGLNLAIGVQAFTPPGLTQRQQKQKHKNCECAVARRPSCPVRGVGTLGSARYWSRSRIELLRESANSDLDAAGEDSDALGGETSAAKEEEEEAIKEVARDITSPKTKQTSAKRAGASKSKDGAAATGGDVSKPPVAARSVKREAITLEDAEAYEQGIELPPKEDEFPDGWYFVEEGEEHDEQDEAVPFWTGPQPKTDEKGVILGVMPEAMRTVNRVVKPDKSQEIEVQTDEEFHWYLIRCFATYELRCRESLESCIPAFGLADRVDEVYVPIRQVVKTVGKSVKLVDEPLFPGYIYCHAKMSKEVRDTINDMEKIVCFMGSQRDQDRRVIPERVEDSLVDGMKQREQEIAATSKPSLLGIGDLVEITEGSFIGKRGEISKIREDQYVLKVNAFGRNTEVKVSWEGARKLTELEVERWFEEVRRSRDATYERVGRGRGRGQVRGRGVGAAGRAGDAGRGRGPRGGGLRGFRGSGFGVGGDVESEQELEEAFAARRFMEADLEMFQEESRRPSSRPKRPSGPEVDKQLPDKAFQSDKDANDFFDLLDTVPGLGDPSERKLPSLLGARMGGPTDVERAHAVASLRASSTDGQGGDGPGAPPNPSSAPDLYETAGSPAQSPTPSMSERAAGGPKSWVTESGQMGSAGALESGVSRMRRDSGGRRGMEPDEGEGGVSPGGGGGGLSSNDGDDFFSALMQELKDSSPGAGKDNNLKGKDTAPRSGAGPSRESDEQRARLASDLDAMLDEIDFGRNRNRYGDRGGDGGRNVAGRVHGGRGMRSEAAGARGGTWGESGFPREAGRGGRGRGRGFEEEEGGYWGERSSGGMGVGRGAGGGRRPPPSGRGRFSGTDQGSVGPAPRGFMGAGGAGAAGGGRGRGRPDASFDSAAQRIGSVPPPRPSRAPDRRGFVSQGGGSYGSSAARSGSEGIDDIFAELGLEDIDLASVTGEKGGSSSSPRPPARGTNPVDLWDDGGFLDPSDPMDPFPSSRSLPEAGGSPPALSSSSRPSSPAPPPRASRMPTEGAGRTVEVPRQQPPAGPRGARVSLGRPARGGSAGDDLGDEGDGSLFSDLDLLMSGVDAGDDLGDDGADGDHFPELGAGWEEVGAFEVDDADDGADGTSAGLGKGGRGEDRTEERFQQFLRQREEDLTSRARDPTGPGLGDDDLEELFAESGFEDVPGGFPRGPRERPDDPGPVIRLAQSGKDDGGRRTTPPLRSPGAMRSSSPMNDVGDLGSIGVGIGEDDGFEAEVFGDLLAEKISGENLRRVPAAGVAVDGNLAPAQRRAETEFEGGFDSASGAELGDGLDPLDGFFDADDISITAVMESSSNASPRDRSERGGDAGDVIGDSTAGSRDPFASAVPASSPAGTEAAGDLGQGASPQPIPTISGSTEASSRVVKGSSDETLSESSSSSSAVARKPRRGSPRRANGESDTTASPTGGEDKKHGVSPRGEGATIAGMKVAELKAKCKAMGLPVSGRKAELQDRILKALGQS